MSDQPAMDDTVGPMADDAPSAARRARRVELPFGPQKGGPLDVEVLRSVDDERF